MAAKTPAAFGTNGWVDPGKELYGGIIGAAQDILVDGAKINLDQLTRYVVYFADIDNTDTWTSGISGIKCVGLVTADCNGVVTPSVGWDAAGVLTFAGPAAGNWAGWVMLWIDDPRFQYGKKSA